MLKILILTGSLVTKVFRLFTCRGLLEHFHLKQGLSAWNLQELLKNMERQFLLTLTTGLPSGRNGKRSYMIFLLKSLVFQTFWWDMRKIFSFVWALKDRKRVVKKSDQKLIVSKR